MTVKLAVIYYSATSTTYQLARAIEEGAQQAGAEVRFRKVKELAPDQRYSRTRARPRTRWKRKTCRKHRWTIWNGPTRSSLARPRAPTFRQRSLCNF